MDKVQKNAAIAKTILQQLGGGTFMLMTGAKELLLIDDGIQFSAPNARSHKGTGRRVSKLRIVLAANDTYTVTSYMVRRGAVAQLESEDNIYCDGLRASFTRLTGLDTHL